MFSELAKATVSPYAGGLMDTPPKKNLLISKLEGHVDHLFTSYLNVVAEYRLVAPMLYDQKTAEHHGKGTRGPGFATVRYVLYRHIVQECWKLACDTDKRTPSIVGIMVGLQQPGVKDALRSRYSQLRIPIADTVDAATKAILERMEAAEDGKRAEEFDSKWKLVHDQWATFKAEPFREGIATLRDKVTAHTELRLVDGKYERADLAGVVKFGDERRFLEGIKDIVINLNLLVRQAGFIWDEFDEQVTGYASAYWATT